MLVKIFVTLAIVIVIVAVYGLIKMPVTFTVKRSLALKGSPEQLFPHINSARRIQEWNAFTEGDATLKISYDGPEEGVGSSCTWVGNSESGAGKMTITESEPNHRVGIRLDFEKPFKGTNMGEYLLEPMDGGTLVTQSIVEKSFPPRLISVFVDLDKVIGTKFEKGLANLKSLAER